MSIAKQHQLDFITPFHAALDAEHYSLAAILLKAAQGIDGKDERGWRPLHWAIVADDWNLVHELLAEGADITAGRKQNAWDVAKIMESEAKLIEALISEKGTEIYIKGTPLLIWAIEKRHMDIVKFLVEKGADINVQDREGYTALIWAARYGHMDKVRYLVEREANVNVRNNFGYTALLWAAINGEMDKVKFLVEHGADINIHNSEDNTALMRAVRRGNMDIISYLVEHGADIYVQNANGGMLLILATYLGHKDIIKTLLDLWHTHESEGTDIVVEHSQNAVDVAEMMKNEAKLIEALVDELKAVASIYNKNNKNWRLLHWAIVADDWDLVRKFLAEGADITAGRYFSAVDIAQEMESEIKLIEALVAVKGETDIYFGDTSLLMWAAIYGYVDTLRCLVEQGAVIDMYEEDGDGRTLEELIKWETSRAVARYLKIHAQNTDGYTELTLAAAEGHMEKVKYLVEQGTDIDAQDKYGKTAMMYAARYGDIDIVMYLVEQGADINLKTSEGKTALAIAEEREYQEIIDILRTAQEQQALKPAA